MQKLVFNGRNRVAGLPTDLDRTIAFLLAKESEGFFQYSGSVEDWESAAEFIREPLNLGYRSHELAAAVGLAYIACLNDGHIDFPEDVNQWSFAHAMQSFIGYSNWDAGVLSNVVKSFDDSEADVHHFLGVAIRGYCQSYFDNGVLLLGHLEQFVPYIYAGLMTGNYDRFCGMFPPSDSSDLFVDAVLHTWHMPDEAIHKAYDVSLSFDAFGSESDMAFLLMVYARLDDARVSSCKERILALLRKDASKYVRPVCDWVFSSNGSDSFAEECILELIAGLEGDSRETSLKIIDKSLACYDNVDFLVKVVSVVADTYGPMTVRQLDRVIGHLSEDKNVFQSLVLSFILHKKGLYRALGRCLWDNYFLSMSDFNPFSLSEKEQIIFIVNMLRDFGNPETRLPRIVPLFESTSQSVCEVLISSIKDYTDEYMGFVVNSINDAGIDNELTRALKKYVEDRSRLIEKRRGLKELSPSYVQNHYYAEARRVEKAHLRQVMNEISKESTDSFLKDIGTTVLARSGGWRDKKGKVNHLVPVEVSCPARQMEHAMMPIDRYSWMSELLADYED